MFFNKYTLFFAFLFWIGVAQAQQDSLLLHPEKLAEKDIYIPMETQKKNIKIISGSHFPIAAGDLPFSVHVITREEIRRNGYETLVDALKMVPGIRVSQPGSATEGETFLMRGLLGNTYTKILINDVPVKPSMLASMPIGAQLPIKEAERIEIIFGAGAALYGSDAGAGVINIITRESDKPVFMQADLAVGTGVYSSVNVMFGGRLGRDKRIFNYLAYGSNVLFERRNIFNNKNNFDPLTYVDSPSDTAFALLPNYGGTAANPILTNTGHLSRKFGFNLKYKRLTLSAETMYRRDHSSLGLNPVAYSYRNPQTYTGESILKFNLNIYKEKEKKNRKTDFTYVRYKLDSRSSILPVQNRLSLMLLDAATAKANLNGNDSTLQYFTQSYNKYLNGLRYMFGESSEFRVEHVRNYRLFQYITLTVGTNVKFVDGYPLTSLLARPTLDNRNQLFSSGSEYLNDENVFPVSAFSGGFSESNAFSQLFYNGNKLKLAAGFNYTNVGLSLGDEINGNFSGTSPRLAGLYNIVDNVNIRTAWGISYRTQNIAYRSNSYVVNSQEGKPLFRSKLNIMPEKTTSWESGIRWKREGGNVGADLTLFVNRTSRLLRYRYDGGFSDPDSTIFTGHLGYTNFENSFVKYTGGQASLFFETVFNDKKYSDGLLSYSWLNVKSGVSGLDEGFFLSPPHGSTLQFRNSFTLFKESTIIVDIIRYKDIATAYFPKTKSKFWTWDIVWRYAFTNRFDCYLKIINLFNKEYSGIQPEADPMDLLRYNPQSGFFLRLGMNYNIE
ncbi:MAG: TonB-dependent receptor [Saprospiraceae bacterium]|nr:TonB-dependent receptor [Saprospiraceae bacterium]MCF8252048.1 TonB-dependent receptor [Saprospiraceae bacterium]MCF8281737.1 TonB-dependent receptor [Bacteroidales bacterium]MCF8310375.1 TonB-dependent receptor [Saprospiraceae bacterium]MCF8439753.1 TonB-dependent receptor [Saprospiraceae bacterium]